MDFQTKITIKKELDSPITYHSAIFLLGSCFSENIAKKLSYYKFKSDSNPFGILFHPKAIKTLIYNAINQKKYVEQDLGFNNQQWYCFDAHSSLNNNDKQAILQQLNHLTTQTNLQIKQASHLIITLGTAWVYQIVNSDKIVANCHKIPQKNFVKKLLSVNDIITDLNDIINSVKEINPSVKIIFTVSPVRHLKDGFIENQQSKAHLLSAVHAVIANQNNVFYFPSYEIMMDELRDYRFYAEDMIHPNQTAINYIWSRFTDTWFCENTQKTMGKIEAIQKGLAHKPFNENSEQHQVFLQNLQEKIVAIKKEFSFINF